MFGLFEERIGGVARVIGTYPTRLEAVMARTEYLRTRREEGFTVHGRGVTTFLRGGRVKLEVWIERVEYPN